MTDYNRIKSLWGTTTNSDPSTIFVTSDLSNTVVVKCPYCTWENTHQIKVDTQGHRECDGPVQSRIINGEIQEDFKMYYCPGYNILLSPEKN